MKPIGWRYDSYRHSLAARGFRSYSAIMGFMPEEKKKIQSVLNKDPRLKMVVEKSVVNIIPTTDGTAHWGGGDLSLNMRRIKDDELHGTIKHEAMHAAHDLKVGAELGVGSFMGPYEVVRNRTSWPEFSGERTPRDDWYVDQFPGSYSKWDVYSEKGSIVPRFNEDVDANVLMPTEVLAYTVPGTRGRDVHAEEFKYLQEHAHPDVVAVVDEDVRMLKDALQVAPRLRTFKDQWAPDRFDEKYVIWKKGPWKLRSGPDDRWSDPESVFRLRAEAEFKNGRGTVDYPSLVEEDSVPVSRPRLSWEYPNRIPKHVQLQALRFLTGRMAGPKTDEVRSEIGMRKMFAARRV